MTKKLQEWTPIGPRSLYAIPTEEFVNQYAEKFNTVDFNDAQLLCNTSNSMIGQMNCEQLGSTDIDTGKSHFNSLLPTATISTAMTSPGGWEPVEGANGNRSEGELVLCLELVLASYSSREPVDHENERGAPEDNA